MSSNLELYRRLIITLQSGDGYEYLVQPDPDGLGCVELTYTELSALFGTESGPKRLLTVSPQEARQIANALIEVADFVDEAAGCT